MKNLITIAIVDDDPICRRIIEKLLLKDINFEIAFEAENGEDCLNKLKLAATAPSIIILDIEMPVMDGYKTAERLKCCWPKIIIIAHSSLQDQRDIDRIISCGAHYFLSKHREASALKILIKKIINLKDQAEKVN